MTATDEDFEATFTGDGPVDTRGWVDPDLEPTSTHALFDGDEGHLALPARRALVVLLKRRFVSAQSHPEEWRAIVENATLLRPRLNDMFLGLHLDTDREVAFKYQVTPEGGTRFPTLLHATEWTREETILLVRLRSIAHATRATGETRVFADRQDLLDYVAAMRPEHATDRSRDGYKATRAVESLVSAGLLIGRKDAGTFEVARAIDVLLPLERLKQLLAWMAADTDDTSGLADPSIDGERSTEVTP